MIGGAAGGGERRAGAFQRETGFAGGDEIDGIHAEQEGRGGDLLAVGVFKPEPIDKSAACGAALGADERLSDQFNVSRSTVREALKRLAAQSL
ncbi:MAG: GntR family transcriptional regulator, partial [Pseudomonadota bacterium]